MNKIRVVDPYEPDARYPEDVKRIVESFAAHDLDVAPEQAEHMWQLYSDGYAAGWLILPEDNEDIFRALSRYYEVVEG